MKYLAILVCYLVIHTGFVFGQDKKDIHQELERKSKDFDINAIDPNEIPTEKELRQLGVPEDEISKLLKLKNKETNNQKIEKQEAGNTLLSEESTHTPNENIPVDKMSQKLPPALIYGQSFFRNKNINFFEKASNIKAPDNYVLGAGDEINVAVWGYSDFNQVFKISENGSISPQGVGRIYLKGLTFKDSRALIKRKFSNYLNLDNSLIDISLTYSRVITINIVGEVIAPGSYTISAINTAFNALISAKGPNQIGSVREIIIKRGGKKIKTLDLYEFLLNPDSKEDFFLQNNDYIFVPPSGKVVEIDGEIKRPFKYELIEDEHIYSLIKYAGGTKPTAYLKNIQILRLEENKEVLIDLPYDSLLLRKTDFHLEDGDKITINSIPSGATNFVFINGAVKIPGEYELQAGDRVSDILNRAEGPLFDAYLGKAFVISIKNDMSKEFKAINLGDILQNENSTDNLLLQNYDEIKVFSKASYKGDYYVSIFGAVSMPGEYLFGEDLTLKDLLYLAGGLKIEAANNRIEISRILNLDESVKEAVPTRTIIKRIEIQKDLSIDNTSADFLLQPYDQVFIRKIPDFELQENVKVLGEVMYPGIYSLLSKDEHLSDIIKRAGGITNWAFIEGAKLYRTENDIGFLFSDFKKALDNPEKSRYNYILKQGDVITIPKENELVQIKGAVNYPNIDEIGDINAPYTKSKNARYYIRKYGVGFKDNAVKRKTIVIQPGGYVNKTVSFGLFKLYPKVDKGAEIIVKVKDTKPKEEKEKREPLDWNVTLENFMVKATAVLTIILLVDRLQ